MQGRAQDRSLFVDALAECGLPEELADAAESTEYDEAVRISHHGGMDLVGQEVGTPVIRVPGEAGETVAFFGPIITKSPKGDDALRLWDGVLQVASLGDFFELKRSRNRDLDFT